MPTLAPRSTTRHPISMALTSIILLTSLLVAVSTVALTPIASAHASVARAPRDGANQATVQLASPAVVRIVTIIEAQLICQACLSDGSSIQSPAAGQQPFVFGSAGSGAFISSDGYILTADHVVDHNTNNAEDVDFILQAAAQDIAQQYPTNTPDQILQFLENNLSRVQINMQVVLQKVFLSTAYTGTLQSTGDVISYDVTRIVTNSPIDQDDTAIIKVEASDMPFLPIAPANSISVGDQVTAIAYPADADDALRGQNFFALADPSQSDANTLNSLLEASVNTGQVTAKKNLSNGTPVYEAGSIASQGSSGGPVVDDQGRIIGFVDAGPSSGTDRVTFLVPSEVIAQYVKQSGNSNPTTGNFQTLWVKANQEQNATGACHWTKAASDYQKLHDQYPRFAGVDSILATAKSHATPSECPPPTPFGLFAGIGAGVVVLLIVVILMVVLFTRRSKKPAVAAVPAGVPASMPLYQQASLSAPLPTMPSANYTPATPYTPYTPSVPLTPQSWSGAVPTNTPAPIATPVSAIPASPASQQPIAAPYALPATPQPQMSVAPASALVCTNGHVQPSGSTAQFCSVCGAPVRPVLPQ